MLLLTKWCIGIRGLISSILILLIEAFWVGNENAFSFYFWNISISTWYLLLFHAPLSTSSSIIDFSFLSLCFPPSFIRPYFSSSCTAFACVFLSSLPLTLLSPFCNLISLFTPLTSFPFFYNCKNSRYNSAFPICLISRGMPISDS